MNGTVVEEHTHHLPCSLNSESKGRSRGSIILILPEALSETDGLVVRLRLIAGLQMEAGGGGACGAFRH